MDIQDCYKILELEKNCSFARLKQAYRKQVNLWHPDRFPDNPDLKQKAEKRLTKINLAYETLALYISRKVPPRPSPSMPETPAKQKPHRPNIEKVFVKQKKKTTKPLDIEIHPWRRCFARGIDLFLIGLLLGFLKVYVFISHFNIPVPAFIAIVLFLWIFFEAGFLTLAGKTPGKLFLNISITDSDNKKPLFAKALKRSFSVWIKGMGLGFIVFTPLTMLISYYKLKKERITSWDRKGEFKVKYRPTNTTRYVLLALFIVIYSFILYHFISIQTRFNLQYALNTEHTQKKALFNGDHKTDAKDGIPGNPDTASFKITKRQAAPVPLPVVQNIENKLKKPVVKDQKSKPARNRNQKTDIIPDNNYFKYIKTIFVKCNRIMFCKPDHSEKKILATLINKYQFCKDGCNQLKALPDGLRYVGQSGTVRLVINVLEAIDAYYSSVYEQKGLGKYNRSKADNNDKKIAAAIHYLIGKKYGKEEENLLNFIYDYKKLSEKLYKGRVKTVALLFNEQKKVLADQKKREKEKKLYEKLIKSGKRTVETFEDAMIFYHPQNGESLLIWPPLPPLSKELRSNYFIVSGYINGIYKKNGINYRAFFKKADMVYYFMFHPAKRIADPDFRIGRPITLIGRLINSDTYPSENGRIHQMPVFEAIYIK